ncbi:hypothetical protein PHYSODRAFT_327447 [Phytophthora sojae]|uniref:HNH nuclease domain-containing protein n=1 Tax=Phytophthora sojae (strain P6497) TaxID=1094619 RepID=G4Z9L9_PHYSP|nr:hypothetical protein PHYSODRAFT_327447 [Phytophthora sojae]EGZ19133.1 hypothetical protein PHYSODRAFT_327447 [Phytophthora sojae]|eukprot:XP_009521850.1 hypothetical protein PHYSODRAFT_327447 [Phytophthora sojae]
MGNSNSAALESPLQEPQGSMKALDGSSIAKRPTTLRVKASSLRTRATVTDLETNSTIGLFKGKMFSSRVVLETPQGQIIASISNKTFSSKYRVFRWDKTDDPSFMIQDASGFFKTMVLIAEFTDTETGTPYVKVSLKRWGADVLKALRKANPDISCPVRLMQLFTAIKDGRWLADDGNVALQLRRGECTDEVNEMLTGPAEKDQIHLLVTVPRYQIFDRKVVAVDCGARWRESSSMAPSSEFKASLTKTYSCDMGDGKLRCMLLNEVFPSELVVAFHLFHRNKQDILQKFMSFDDVDDVGNGLVLFRPLINMFDEYKVSFIYDEASDQFRLKVFDKSLLGERLFSKLSSEEREVLLGGNKLPHNWEEGGEWVVPGMGFNIQTTFKGVDGRALSFGATLQRPYKRCLCLQAHVARKIAVKMEWIQPEEGAFEDFREEGMSLTEKMPVFHASQR